MAITPEEIQRLTDAYLRQKQTVDQLRDAQTSLASGTEAYRNATLRLQQAEVNTAQAELELAIARNETADTIQQITNELNQSTVAFEANKAAIEAATKQAEIGQQTFGNLAGQIGLMDESARQSNLTLNVLSASGLKGLMKGAADVLNPLNMLQSIFALTIESSLELAKALDETTSSLNMTTGLGDEFHDSIVDLQPALNDLAIFVPEIGEAFGVLGTRLGTFTNLSKDAQMNIGRTTAVLGKFGVSAEQTAENIGIMTATMGVSEEQAAFLQAGLVNMANENQISSVQMMNDFAATAESLAAFGDQSVEVFGDLAMAAKQSNMEVSELLGIASQFDTFDGATQAVGRLNALLGGPFLNSLEMVMVTDPTERISMLSDALNATGRSFQDMSYYERRAIADAAGLSSVADLGKVMSGNFEGLAGNIGKSAEELEKMENMQADFMSLTDEIKSLLMEFAFPFLEPVVQGLKSAIKFVKDLSPEFKKSLAIAGGLLVMGKIFSGFMSDTAEQSEAIAAGGGGGGISGFLGDVAKGLLLVGGVILLVKPAFTLLSSLFESIGSGLSGLMELGPALDAIKSVGAADFLATAAGIKAISTAVNDIETDKAVAISTVFDSAAATTATQTINSAAMTSAGASAAGATGQTMVAAPIEITTKLMLNEREMASVVRKHETLLKLADDATNV
jgi:hypothetical protein